MAEAAIHRLENSPLTGRRIFWLDTVEDRQLDSLYRHAVVLLYPSLYEGWGLPVVEALALRLLLEAGCTGDPCVFVVRVRSITAGRGDWIRGDPDSGGCQ